MNYLRKFFRSGLWIMVVAFGCQRGCSCTTSKVIDTESKKILTDGVNLKLEAEKVETKHMRVFALRSEPTYYTYSVSYNLRVENRPWIKGVLGLPIEKSDDLEEMLELVGIKFSSEKKHFAVYEKEELLKVYHLLEQGIPFTTTWAEGGKTIDYVEEFKTDKLPSPEEIMRGIIQDSVLYSTNELVIQALSEQKIPSEFDDLLFEKFPEKNLMIEVFRKNKRLDKLMNKDNSWRMKMNQKILDFYKALDSAKKEDIIGLKVYEGNIIDLIALMGNKAPLRELDEQLLTHYPFTETSRKYYEKRKDMTAEAIPISIMDKMKQSALSALNDKNKEIQSEAFDFMMKTRDYPNRKKALDTYISPDNIDSKVFDISRIVYMDFNKFTPDEQKLIIDKSEYLLINHEVFHKNIIYGFLSEHLECARLKMVVEKVNSKDSFAALSLPERCQSQ